MRRALAVLLCIASAACAQGPKVALTIGLLFPQKGGLVTGDLYTNSCNLALQHIAEGGGMRGNGQIVFATEDTLTNAAKASEVLTKLVDERGIKAAIGVSSGETLSLAGQAPSGAGPTAASLQTPLLCIGCTAPELDCVSLHLRAFGASGTGSAASCADPNAGSITRPGYVYRLSESSAAQGSALAAMALADAAEAGTPLVAAALAVASPFGVTLVDQVFKPAVLAANARFVRLATHAIGPASGEAQTAYEAAVRAAFDAAVADDPAFGAVNALVVGSFPEHEKLITQAYAASEKKPALYFPFTGYSSEVLAVSEQTLVGSKGVTYAVAAGPSPGTFVVDYAAFANVANQQVRNSLFVDAAYDAVMMLALAIYATGEEDPSAEDVKRKLDTLNDPNGVVIGYRQFFQARKAIDAGKTINYQGVSGALDFDSKNGVKSPLAPWIVAFDGKAPMFRPL